jgi:hypothetical protein
MGKSMSKEQTARRRAKKCGYQCSRCDKRLPSPEAGNAHLEKKHDGYGFLVWKDYRRAA